MTKGSHSSLHKSEHQLAENKAFDESFRKMCGCLSNKGDISGSKQETPPENTDYYAFCNDVLSWHKDRKSYIDDKSRDPHVA